MSGLIKRIKRGDFKQIIICSGAGVSTGAGIPDYRSADGIFQMLGDGFSISDPSDVFSRWFRDKHPEFVDHPAYQGLLDQVRNAEPTPAHMLAFWLSQKGWLKRVFTQNIDGLYQKAGVPEDLIVEFHGNLLDGVVLYGDPIPEMCLLTTKNDHMDSLRGECDLMLVMGTSLQVAPFCGIPNMVRRSCVRAYVDLTPSVDNNFGGGYFEPSKTTKFYQKVALSSRWNRGHYHREYIVRSDCSKFSDSIINDTSFSESSNSSSSEDSSLLE